jgi:muconolactone delta-isomerase
MRLYFSVRRDLAGARPQQQKATDTSPQDESSVSSKPTTNLILEGYDMKIMAIGTLKPLTPEEQRTYLPKEVPATLQIYLDGKMEQFWLREGNAGVIFLMNVDSVEEADAILKALPLGQANLLTFELMPIGPLTPLGMLIK